MRRQTGPALTAALAAAICCGLIYTAAPAAQTATDPEVWTFDRLDRIGGHPTDVQGNPRVIDTPIGKAVEFDGVDDALFVDVHPLAGAKTFTWEAIFRPDGGNVEQRWFHLQETGSENRMLFEIRVVGDRWFLDSFNFSTTGTATLMNKSSLHPLAAWYHVAAVYDGKVFTSYVNGVQDATAQVDLSPQGQGRSSMGVRINQVYYFKGAIHSARFTRRALPPESFLKVPQVRAANRQPWTRHVIDSSSRGADGVRTADINGDGVPDLVASWEQGGVTRVYLGSRGKAGEPAWRALTVGKSPDAEDSVFFDADGDGAVDVVASTEGDSRRILVHWAPSRARYANEHEWKTETLYSDGSQWMFAVPMDVDRRRGVDLIVGGKNERASVAWLESPARPRDVREWTFHRLTEAGWIMSLIVRDMNGDGRADILLSDRRGGLAGVRWLEHPGLTASVLHAPWRNHWIGARGREAMLIDAADLDGDGVVEIVVPHYRGNDFRLSIFRMNGAAPAADGWTEYPVRYPPIGGRPKAAAIGDIDLDGRPDLVLSSEEARGDRRGIVWLRARTSPFDAEWEAYDVSGPEGVKFDLNLLLDVDRDGDLDILNTEENNNAASGNPGLGVVWYENPARRP
jgi:hypothetical protein